jgi:hypothetical protein
MECFFPCPVNLTVANGNTTLRFKAGFNDVDDALIGHWWLKANGVFPFPSDIQPTHHAFEHLDQLIDGIDAYDDSSEAEARSIFENEIAEARVARARVWEQVRMVLEDNLDAVKGLAARLDKIAANLKRNAGPTCNGET